MFYGSILSIFMQYLHQRLCSQAEKPHYLESPREQDVAFHEWLD